MELQKYTKKKLEVNAVKFTGEIDQLGELTEKGMIYTSLNNDSTLISVKTPNGEKNATIGDYILMNVNGDFSVCAEKDFLLLYEKDNLESSEENYSSLNKYNFILNHKTMLLICFLLGVVTTVLSIAVYSKINRRNIEDVVKICYKAQIEEESKKLLAKTKLEADEIIESAKDQAKKEAQEAFRSEMERITNEKIGSSK